MTLSIAVCLIAFALLIALLRTDRISLGLPIAYLFSLLLIHVPGAIAHLVDDDVLLGSEYTEAGIRFTAIGAACFVIGVWAARQRALPDRPAVASPDRWRFWLFCLAAGWIVTYLFSLLRGIPSLAAVVDKAGAVWMLGVMLGLRASMRQGDARWTAIWLASLAIYPVLVLLLGGFLSYGTAAVIIVTSVLIVSTRSTWRTVIGVLVISIVATNLFISYFGNRRAIRDAVWGGAPMEDRVEASLGIFRDFEWFDPTNVNHLAALDLRLNQNYFAGLAASRIDAGYVDYLRGRSLWEGVISIVPRAIWPEKPVFGGSPEIVAHMTGLNLSETTSWGVGNVMEFQINFGIPGIVAGFLVLGWLLGTLDRGAAAAEATGHLGTVFLYFLPAAALIQPNASLVEIVGGAAAGLIAALVWRRAWQHWSERLPA
jgi:hypothetical protein